MADDSLKNSGITSFWGLRRTARPSNLQAADESGDAIGLYLSGRQAFLARASASHHRLPVISQHLAVTLDARPAVAAEELREHLRALGGGRMPGRLWTCLQSPGMVLQALRIPHVRPSGMASAAFWTLKKERNFHAEDTVFDIELLRTVEEEGATRLELLAVAVPKEELSDHQQFNAEFGTPATGVSPPVFAFRNFLRLGYPELNHGPCAVLFVNDASSDVFVFNAGQILAVRTLRTGLDSLRDAIAQTLDIDPEDPRTEACLRLLAEEDVDETVFGADPVPSVDDVFGWSRPVARWLARNIQRTLHAFDDTLESSATPTFLVAGTVTRYDRLVRFLGDQVGVALTPFAPSKSEFLQHIQPAEGKALPEESGMALAVGLALADCYNTPNLLFTYEDRLRLRKRATIAQALRASGMVLLIALVVSTVALRYYLHSRQQQSVQLLHTVAKGAEVFNRDDIEQDSRQAIRRQLTTRELARAYYAPGVIAEVSGLTPESVYLLEVHVELLPQAAEKTPKTSAGRAGRNRTGKRDEKAATDMVRIGGVIQGAPERMDAILAEYVCRLQQSRFFQTPTLTERKLEKVSAAYIVFGKKTADHLLFFTIETVLRDLEPAKKEGSPKG